MIVEYMYKSVHIFPLDEEADGTSACLSLGSRILVASTMSNVHTNT